MKALISSILLLAVSVAGWLVFLNYTHDTLHSMIDQIKDQVLIQVEAGNWEEASDDFDEVSKEWHKEKKKYALFLDSSAILNTDFSVARTKGYLEAKDTSLATGELKCIVEQLGFLHANEKVTWENLF